jgi:hypothetical protein
MEVLRHHAASPQRGKRARAQNNRVQICFSGPFLTVHYTGQTTIGFAQPVFQLAENPSSNWFRFAISLFRFYFQSHSRSGRRNADSNPSRSKTVMLLV